MAAHEVVRGLRWSWWRSFFITTISTLNAAWTMLHGVEGRELLAGVRIRRSSNALPDIAGTKHRGIRLLDFLEGGPIVLWSCCVRQHASLRNRVICICAALQSHFMRMSVYVEDSASQLLLACH